MCEIPAVVINQWLEMTKKKTTKHTAPGIRWSSPTQLLIQRLEILDVFEEVPQFPEDVVVRFMMLISEC